MKNLNYEDFLNENNGLETYSNDDILNEITKRQLIENPFPLHVFHKNIRNFINYLCSSEGFDIPSSFVGTALLSSYSTAIGTSYFVTTNGQDGVPLPIWGCLLGISSSGKSLAINKIFEPLVDIQSEFDKEWETQTEGMNENQMMNLKMNTVIFRDVHIPTLVRNVIPDNPKGVLKMADELVEWINGMNQLSKKEGTDEQFWLSSWSCTSYTGIRSGKQKFVNRRPFVNILGGTQNSLLPKFFANDRDTSGFVFRILFARPNSDKISMQNPFFEMPKDAELYHYKSIQTLYNGLRVESDYNIPNKVRLDYDAILLYHKWSKEKNLKINSIIDIDEKNIEAGIFGKIKEYVLRFVGILALSDKVLNTPLVNDKFNTIFLKEEIADVHIMERAIELGEYYLKETKAIYSNVKVKNTAPKEVLLAAHLFKQAKLSNLAMAKLVYPNSNKSDAALKKQMERDLKKWIIAYPKVFGSNAK